MNLRNRKKAPLRHRLGMNTVSILDTFSGFNTKLDGECISVGTCKTEIYILAENHRYEGCVAFHNRKVGTGLLITPYRRYAGLLE